MCLCVCVGGGVFLIAFIKSLLPIFINMFLYILKHCKCRLLSVSVCAYRNSKIDFKNCSESQHITVLDAKSMSEAYKYPLKQYFRCQM